MEIFAADFQQILRYQRATYEAADALMRVKMDAFQKTRADATSGDPTTEDPTTEDRSDVFGLTINDPE